MGERKAIAVGLGTVFTTAAVFSTIWTSRSGVDSGGKCAGGATPGQPKTTSYSWKVAEEKWREAYNMDPMSRYKK